jgi:hypothetical protein
MEMENLPLPLFPVNLLLNTSTNRMHFIVFRPASAPSEDEKDEAHRYRSLGHHTDGFDTRDEAVAFIMAKIKEGKNWSFLDMTWQWDGQDLPVMTFWFADKDIQNGVRN